MTIEFSDDNQDFTPRFPIEQEPTGFYKIFLKFGINQQQAKGILIATFLTCSVIAGYITYSTVHTPQVDQPLDANVKKAISQRFMKANR